MKNSRLSDRELAKKIGSSQPTVTRTRRKLEKQGYIREYTVIPNFEKLGYELLAVTFVKLKKELTAEQVEKARKFSLEKARESTKTGPFEGIMAERGMGLGFNGLFMSFHENYSSYVKFMMWLRTFPFFDASAVESFLIDLKSKIRYKPLTFSNLARHILTLNEKKK